MHISFVLVSSLLVAASIADSIPPSDDSDLGYYFEDTEPILTKRARPTNLGFQGKAPGFSGGPPPGFFSAIANGKAPNAKAVQSQTPQSQGNQGNQGNSRSVTQFPTSGAPDASVTTTHITTGTVTKTLIPNTQRTSAGKSPSVPRSASVPKSTGGIRARWVGGFHGWTMFGANGYHRPQQSSAAQGGNQKGYQPQPSQPTAAPSANGGQFYNQGNQGSGNQGGSNNKGGQGQQSQPAAPAPSATSGSSGSAGSNSGYMATVNKWRSASGLPALSEDSKLEANALKTCNDHPGKMVHELNPGSMGQVLAPGDAGNFESVYVGGWLCEKKSLPGINGVCASMEKGWDHSNGETGHADILTSTGYKKIGCANAGGIWACDLA